jgi:hypothetical protein
MPKAPPDAADRKYYLTYKFENHPDGLPLSEVERLEGKGGACDAVFLMSILFREDGGLSFQDWSCDGRTGDGLGIDMYFKIWAHFAGMLAEQLPPGGRRDLCESVFETIRAVILKSPHVPGPEDLQ